MSIRENRVLVAVLVLSLVGIGLSTFLVANHYQYVDAKFCSVGPWADCEDVNRGAYSTIFGVPWSVIGFVGFLAVFVLAYIRLYYPEKDSKERFIPLILLFSILGTVFVVYLNYLEFFVIGKLCLLCAASHIVMISILIIVSWWHLVGRHRVVEEAGPEVTEAPADPR